MSFSARANGTAPPRPEPPRPATKPVSLAAGLNWPAILQGIPILIVLAVTAYYSLVVLPAMREASQELKDEMRRITKEVNESRAAQETHLKKMEAAHKQQRLNASLLLIEQEKNLKLAQQVAAKLKGD